MMCICRLHNQVSRTYDKGSLRHDGPSVHTLSH